MSFRVSGRERDSGRPCAPYESDAATEAEVRLEAERLGIEIERLDPIETLSANALADDAQLADWNWPELRWRSARRTLLRLGFEHPHWGKVLWTTAMVSAILLKSKVVPKLLALMLGSLLVLAGIRASPEALLIAMIVAFAILPFAVAKPYVFLRLRRAHAPDGFDRERRLAVRGGQVHWFDGEREHVLSVRSVHHVYELPHFVLVQSRHVREFAIPRSVFHSATLARTFAARLADATGAIAHLNYRSAWVGEKRERTPLEQAGATVALFLGIAMLLIAAITLVMFWR